MISSRCVRRPSLGRQEIRLTHAGFYSINSLRMEKAIARGPRDYDRRHALRSGTGLHGEARQANHFIGKRRCSNKKRWVSKRRLASAWGRPRRDALGRANGFSATANSWARPLSGYYGFTRTRHRVRLCEARRIHHARLCLSAAPTPSTLRANNPRQNPASAAVRSKTKDPGLKTEDAKLKRGRRGVGKHLAGGVPIRTRTRHGICRNATLHVEFASPAKWRSSRMSLRRLRNSGLFALARTIEGNRNRSFDAAGARCHDVSGRLM